MVGWQKHYYNGTAWAPGTTTGGSGGGGGVITPPVSTLPTYTGYTLLHHYDLSRDEGWTLESGKPSNADGVDRPSNVTFGQGPDGTSMLIRGMRDNAGGTFYTGDALGKFKAIPNYHRSYAVVEWDPFSVGMWPAVWKRPLSGPNLLGEIDDWEKFGGHGAPYNNYPIDAGTLHGTPYGPDPAHAQLQRGFPTLGTGRHTIETELKVGLFSWWVNGTLAGTITPAQFDAAPGTAIWADQFGQAAKTWYFRATLQAGGSEGGPIPADMMLWRYWVHNLAVYAPG